MFHTEELCRHPTNPLGKNCHQNQNPTSTNIAYNKSPSQVGRNPKNELQRSSSIQYPSPHHIYLEISPCPSTQWQATHLCKSTQTKVIPEIFFTVPYTVPTLHSLIYMHALQPNKFAKTATNTPHPVTQNVSIHIRTTTQTAKSNAVVASDILDKLILVHKFTLKNRVIVFSKDMLTIFPNTQFLIYYKFLLPPGP